MMANDKPKRPSADELAARLRAHEKKRRPRRLLILSLLLLLFAVPIALVVWWFWPVAPPPRLRIVAFDAVCRPDQPATLTAQLVRPDDIPETVGLGGWPVEFGSGSLPGEQTPTVAFTAIATRTAPEGRATVEVTRTQAPAV